MDIQQQIVGNSTMLTVSGAHTHRDAGTLRATVDQALRGGAKTVVLDLEGVSELGGAGLGELVSIYAAVRRATGRLVLTRVPRRIRYLLAASGLDAVFATASPPDRAPATQEPRATGQAA